MEEEAKSKGLYTVVKGETGESIVVRNRQIWGGHGEVLAWAALKDHVWVMVLLQLVSVLMSVA